jgi:hypothetical protein
MVRAVIDLEAMVNVKDVDSAAALVDPVDNAVGAASSPVATSEWPK